MIKEIKREELPTRFKIHDSGWNRGIIIGNTAIFTAKHKKETKQIKSIYQKDNYTHGFYIQYKKDPVLKIIYLRE